MRIRVPKEALVVAALVLAVVIPSSRPAYSLTRKRRERGYRREELTRFGRIPSRKSTLFWLAARYAFVDKSILVVTEGLGPRRFHGRVVLMVNEHTASAGEMVAEGGASRPATIATKSGETYHNSESTLFIRQDLLDHYLKQQKLELVIFVWGERRADFLASDSPEGPRALEGSFEIDDVLHRQGFVYQAGSFRKFF